MAEQTGTSGFVRAFLPGLVLGIVIGAATTFAFFSLSEGGTLPKQGGTTPTERSTTPREVGGAVDSDDATDSQDGIPADEQTGDQGDGDGADEATDDSPPSGEGG